MATTTWGHNLALLIISNIAYMIFYKMLIIIRKYFIHVYFICGGINDHCNVKCCSVHDKYYNFKICTSDVLQRESWLFNFFCKAWTSPFQRPNPSKSSSLQHKGGNFHITLSTSKCISLLSDIITFCIMILFVIMSNTMCCPI